MNVPPVSPVLSAWPDWQADVTVAVDVLRGGGVVAYPSETVWGLAAHPDFPGAVRRLRSGKGSAADKPLQVSCSSARQALALARPDAALDTLARHWPGPLTVITPGSETCPPQFLLRGRVGLRVPAHPVALALLAGCGGVLVTTSCNRSGEAPALNREQALASGLADLTLPDGGVAAGGLASTVVLLPEGQILRLGSLGEDCVRDGLRAANRDGQARAPSPSGEPP